MFIFVLGFTFITEFTSVDSDGSLTRAVDAARMAVSLSRGLDPVKGKDVLACALDTLGNRLRELPKYEASRVVYGIRTSRSLRLGYYAHVLVG